MFFSSKTYVFYFYFHKTKNPFLKTFYSFLKRILTETVVTYGYLTIFISFIKFVAPAYLSMINKT